MEILIAKQEARLERLLKSYSNYKKSPKDRITTCYIESRLENLEKLWVNFFEEHLDVYSAASVEDKASNEYFKQDKISLVEEMYTEYKSKLKEDYQTRTRSTNTENTGNPGSSPSPPNASGEIRLPQIQLPSFSGNYEDWQTYYDMFTSVIHNNTNLSAVQKLHYLKGSVTGEPASLLKTFATTEANYLEAWSKLSRRYNNKLYNCNEIMKRIFGQKTLTTESAIGVKQLLDTTTGCLKSLNNIGVETSGSGCEVFVNHLVLSKLDQESRKQWNTLIGSTESDDLPSWQQLTSFLESRFRTLEMDVKSNTQRFNIINNNSNKQGLKQKSFHAAVRDETNTSSSNSVCGMCSGQHFLYQCKQFAKQSPEERSQYVQSQRLCYNCLSSTHGVRSCHQSSCCRRCGRRHHSLLHIERNQEHKLSEQSNVEKGPSTNDSETKVVAHFAKESQQNRVLLATAMVRAKSTNGYSQPIRVLVDQGSEASFITESTVQALGLKRTPVRGLVSGISEDQTVTKGMVLLNLESLHNPKYSVQVNAFVLSTLTSFLPSAKLTISNWPEVNTLPLADPNYGSPGRIDMILGVDVHSEILRDGLLRHPTEDCPIAQNTHFGWILSGKINKNSDFWDKRVVNLHVQLNSDNLLKQFWEIEREPECLQKKLTKEERRGEEIYEETTVRGVDGRYTVRLPFNGPNPQCLYGKTREISLRRFQLLEKQLLKQPSVYDGYRNAIEDYLKQGHMIQITDEKEINDSLVVYLPHHAVIKEDKETTKIRPVYDASCKGINNTSLNDNLLVGPKLQQDLRHILMRWRRHAICIVADLVQMYRQICVDERDTDFQRIFWRSDPTQPIQHFKLMRLTFGTASAPYLAVKTLQQLAKDEQSNYPLASEITLRDYYMDDLLTGCETEIEAIEIYDQMNGLMKAGGFTLQKWCSNSKGLLQHIKKEIQEDDKVTFKINDTVKVLGIRWNKVTDNFEYTLQMPTIDNKPMTKRKVLSDVARLYDPMGWISPVIVTAKIYIQSLWKSGLSWDEPLSSELVNEWHKIRDDLPNIKTIVIPRWLNSKNEDQVELHAFADASQLAYAAAIYMKTVDREGNVYVNLITSKTKVAPVEKQISVPRLELCAALLASKLICEVAEVMQVPKDKLYGWSDSTVVLAWLRGEPSRWNTFVSNRVSEILTILERDQWGHVSTHQNPADCASRGISILDLADNHLWWHGPQWLHNTEYEVGLNHRDFVTDEEQRPVKTFNTIIQQKEDFEWNRFSSLSKALRVLAYCRRFLRLRDDRRDMAKYITVNEMNEVLHKIIKETQKFYFEQESKQIVSNPHGALVKKSPLHTLCPFFDESGILRVGGRIHEAPVDFNKRHPIILPSESHLTKLIIMDAHIKTLHGGPQIMLNFLRSKFWIIRARDLVKRYYRLCVTCVRYSKQNNDQFMGALPEARVKPARAFEVSGVDFTGHINIRFSPGRGSKTFKGYICLFICMVSKAIHLEAVSDLTAQGFIAAFRRFVSRRGHCKHLYSDNGTNFLGADKELKSMVNKASSQLSDEFSQLLAEEGTTWHFIPPHAPNFGGLWEAGVRAAKSHLKRILGNSTVTLEELSTILAQIEACLNSRPLSYLSNNANDPLPLTPGHFLIGEPLIVIPDENCTTSNISGLQRWKVGQKMVNDFWRKWSDEYLVTLNQRYKWTTKKSEPEINDIVIIKDHNVPPAKWLLGKIVDKHPGKDNITRVVTIKSKNGYCKRPCNKLCFLPKSQ